MRQTAMPIGATPQSESCVTCGQEHRRPAGLAPSACDPPGHEVHGGEPRSSSGGGLVRTVRAAAASLWLDLLFGAALRWPSLVRAVKPIFVSGAWRFAPSLRDGPRANAPRLLGPRATASQCEILAKSVVGDFYDFVYDVGRSARMTPQQLCRCVQGVEGQERYDKVRSQKKGAILVTAHLGAFEVALAELSRQERDIHVVYQRDAHGIFERLRSRQRRQLGVHEAPVDEGWSMWLRLRNALQKDHVVLLQGDRVMPGQKGLAMPFLGGHMLMPAGPVKLAVASGSPIVPCFSVRTPSGAVRVTLEQPIHVPNDGRRIDQYHPAMQRLASAIEYHVQTIPSSVARLASGVARGRAGPAGGLGG